MTHSLIETTLYDNVRAVEWAGNMLKLLDQRKLPTEHVYLELRDVKGVADAIANMVVRGAPAIGITAAYGVVLAAREQLKDHPETWKQSIEQELIMLANARPTAVNLAWAIGRMRAFIQNLEGNDIAQLEMEAGRIHQEDIQANHTMAELGSNLLDNKVSVLTHCNTGSLATGGYGTALGVIRKAYEQQKINMVYADETRPWLQGSRLTAWELVQDNIPVTLLADGAAAYLMQQGRVSWVIVGADRIAANGDVANKIGTYNLAVNARQHGVKFMVAAPISTVDFSVSTGADIPIEYRSGDEILQLQSHPIAAKGAESWNPAFDITPASLIDYIVTEKAVIHSPNPTNMAAKLKNAI